MLASLEIRAILPQHANWLSFRHWRRHRSHPPLPVLHRLAIAYLVLPVLIWLSSWFEWWFGLPLAALTALAIGPLMVGPWRTGGWLSPAMQAMLLIAAVWTALSPAGGYFGLSVTDWITHRALFSDLASQPWPLHLSGYADERPRLLIYYSAWYLVPALFGKWLGPAALNWAVPAWTWCGAALILLLFTRGLPLIRAVLAALAFILFSGLDALEFLLHEGLFDGLAALYASFGRGSLEWWYDWGPTRLAFLSMMELFLWGTQHFTAAALGVLLIVQLRRDRRFLAAIGALLACLLMWSPLVAVSLLVLTAGLLADGRVRSFLSWQNLGAGPMLVGVIGLYLMVPTSHPHLPFGGIWDQYDSAAQMAAALSVAYLAEFLLLALLLALAKPNILRNPLFIAVAAISFAAFPIYYGSARINDLAIRFGAPAMVLLAYWAIREAVRLLPRGKGHPAANAPLKRLPAAMLAAALLVGAAGPVSEFMHRVRSVQWLPYESGGWSLVIDRGYHVLRKYSAYKETPRLLAQLLRDADGPAFDRGERLIRSDYDVYRKGERLIYVSDSCNRMYEGFGFFAHVYPSHPDRSAATETKFETLRMDTLPAFVWKGGRQCVAAFRLPRYDIACLHAGQRDPSQQSLIWEGWHPSRSDCAAALGHPLSGEPPS